MLIRKTDTNAFQKTTLVRTHSIVPHHCGDHDRCTSEHFQFEAIELAKRVLRGLLNDENELLFNAKSNINEKRAKASRFKGVVMDTSTKGQEKLLK